MGEEDGQRRIQDLVNDQLKELRDLLWPPNLHVRVLLDRILALVKVDAQLNSRDASGLRLEVDLSHRPEAVCGAQDGGQPAADRQAALTAD